MPKKPDEVGEGGSKRGEQVDIVEKTKLGGELQMFLLLIQARRDVWGMAAFGMLFS